ncbi:4-hydroxythreonine-4-phosphate dehydrogenase PdxA [Stieleria mannarensis]|uniref:4-hydroxythreonine-4-phosphate dehydrogenase PdxA n=1 Tax=Stieleria mannarensis TaxID=2755585 RepID=UPI0015FF783D|nr:4-hydroxythreonine-4-phosphate dehydrogenase PdxA [Rhodopirellula sp. JC639]
MSVPPASDVAPAYRDKPRLAITVGDAAGVGPELALVCAADESVLRRCQPILVGPAAILRKAAASLGLAIPPTTTIARPAGPNQPPAGLIDCGDVALDTFTPGKFSAATGQASFSAVDLAIAETISGNFDAIVTGPIQKEAWHAAGTGYLGHTELLADRTQTRDFCMMLSGQACSTVLATIHVPLADVIASLSVDQIARAIRLGGSAMEKRFGRPPRITVLGLNPHAGENGLLSHGEEENLIRPAMDLIEQECEAENRDWHLVGPVPPDTAFTPAMRDQTDVHICMYHDQGLIPLKALSFDDAVNITLGLPIVRTSVDHGTAMDLAWKGTASANSMRSAIDRAIELCR